MVDRDSQLGSVLLQAMVLLLLLAAGGFFLVAWRDSESIVGNEFEARRVLAAIARAQKELALDAGGYGTLAELLERGTRESEAHDAARSLRRALPERIGAEEVLQHAGYCFVVILVDGAGFESRVAGADLDRSFFIAYAWPEEFARTGRRIFVVADDGLVRAWENRLPGERSYSGPDEAPPGQLAPPPTGKTYPFALERVGAEKTLVWKVIDDGARP